MTIPSIEIIQNGIKFFNEFDWSNALHKKTTSEKYEYIGNKFSTHFQINPVAFIEEYENDNLDLTLFRVRPFSADINKSLICEFSYPPPILTILQRANYPRYPVFYSSTDISTALIEVLRNVNDIVGENLYYISCWGIKNPRNLIHFIFVPENIPKENFASHINYKERIENYLKSRGLNSNEVESIKLLTDFQISLFINPKENAYDLTAFLGHYFLYANHNLKTDILIYPSIKLNHLTSNYAIHPNAADQNLFLKHVFLCAITQINLETNKCSALIKQFAKVENNIIRWHDINPNDESYKEYFEVVDDYFCPTRRRLKEE